MWSCLIDRALVGDWHCSDRFLDQLKYRLWHHESFLENLLLGMRSCKLESWLESSFKMKSCGWRLDEGLGSEIHEHFWDLFWEVTPWHVLHGTKHHWLSNRWSTWRDSRIFYLSSSQVLRITTSNLKILMMRLTCDLLMVLWFTVMNLIRLESLAAFIRKVLGKCIFFINAFELVALIFLMLLIRLFPA